MSKNPDQLRFQGSLWCNLDIAQRNIDAIYRRMSRQLDLAVIEWHILIALYRRDSQNASELAYTVGRAATSFTPNLDKLADKGYIERQPDPHDRRAVRIVLTDKAKRMRDKIEKIARDADKQITSQIPEDQYLIFQEVLGRLQSISDEQVMVS